jgi:hypothetical protein
MLLTVDTLCKRRLERAKINHETYRLLYKMCIDRIERTNKLHAENAGGRWYASACTWSLPYFFPGRPMYEHAHAARYIVDKLRHGGFEVTYDDSNGKFSIDWSSLSSPHAIRQHMRSGSTTTPPHHQQKTDSIDALVTRMRRKLRMT